MKIRDFMLWSLACLLTLSPVWGQVPSAGGAIRFNTCNGMHVFMQQQCPATQVIASAACVLSNDERQRVFAHMRAQTGATKRRCGEELARLDMLVDHFDAAAQALDETRGEASDHRECLEASQRIGVEASPDVPSPLPHACTSAMPFFHRLNAACLDPEDQRVARHVVNLAIDGCIDRSTVAGGTVHPIAEAVVALRLVGRDAELEYLHTYPQNLPWGLTDASLVVFMDRALRMERGLLNAGGWSLLRVQNYLARVSGRRVVGAVVQTRAEITAIGYLLVSQVIDRLREPSRWCHEMMNPTLLLRDQLFAAGADAAPSGADPVLEQFLPDVAPTVAQSRSGGATYLRRWCAIEIVPRHP